MLRTTLKQIALLLLHLQPTKSWTTAWSIQEKYLRWRATSTKTGTEGSDARCHVRLSFLVGNHFHFSAVEWICVPASRIPVWLWQRCHFFFRSFSFAFLFVLVFFCYLVFSPLTFWFTSRCFVCRSAGTPPPQLNMSWWWTTTRNLCTTFLLIPHQWTATTGTFWRCGLCTSQGSASLR